MEQGQGESQGRGRGRPRINPQENSRRVTLTFPQSLIRKLTDEAKNRGVSFAALVREKISKQSNND
jgi:hypothetical protein